MDPTDREEILKRLASIEARLTQHEERIRAIELGVPYRGERWEATGDPQAQPPPPPVVLLRPPPQATPPPVTPPRVPAPPAAAPTPATKAAVDTEYQIGAQILPKAGGLIVIVGLAYLVSLAVGRGLITPAMLWWGANLLAALFIGIGQWKREEREEFGSILTAVGSCGLYLNFAAGHVFQHLYQGETLVVLFVALSLTNLGYALLRSSRVFLGLGLVGGIIAALMPLDRQGYSLNVALTFLVLFPSVLIAAKHRWLEIGMGLWAVGTATLLPIAIDSRAPDSLRVGAILGVGLLTVTGHARSYRWLEFDPIGAFGPFALGVNGLIAFLCLRNISGAGWMVAYGAAIAAAAVPLVKDADARARMYLAAIAIPTCVAPFGFWKEIGPGGVGWTIWILIGLAILFALGSIRLRNAAASALSVIEGALAIGTYLVLVSGRMPVGTESAILAGLILVLAASGWALARTKGNTELVTVRGAMLAVPMITRLAQVVIDAPHVGGTLWQGLATGTAVAATLLTTLTMRTRWVSASQLLAVVVTVSFLAYGVTVVDRPFSLFPELMFIGTLGTALVGGMFVAASQFGTQRVEAARAVSSGMAGLLITRLGVLLLGLPAIGVPAGPAAVLTSSAFAGFAAVIAWRRPMGELTSVAWLFLLGSAGTYVLVLSGPIARAQDLGCAMVMLAALVMAIVATDGSKDEKTSVQYIGLTGAWVLVTRLGFLLLAKSSIGMKDDAAVSTTWIAFAVVLMVAGFARRVRALRMMSFGVLGITVGKVFLVDLAALDAGIRVAVLLLLGLAMIGGGYWYIRTQRPEPAVDSVAADGAAAE